MKLKCGIVGLPNVGKSSFFNALTNSDIPSENYPFCTIDAHNATVEVRDKRIQRISEIVKPQKIIYSTTDFVDIAGLVEGASKGEGLGNKFLAKIGEVNAIMHILRCFEDENIQHVKNRIYPVGDKEIIDTELQLKDLESVEKKIEKVSRLVKNGNKDAANELETYSYLKSKLEEGVNIRNINLSEDQKKIVDIDFLTAKPVFYVANIDEATLRGRKNTHLENVKELAKKENVPVVVVCTKFEEELSKLDEDEKILFLEEFNLEEPTVNNVISITYTTLGLISYFTAGEKEVRAWTVPKGCEAPQAAGAIHSDLERCFIRAEVIKYDDFIKYGSENECKKVGKISIEGKKYVVQDGDIIHFLTNA